MIFGINIIEVLKKILKYDFVIFIICMVLIISAIIIGWIKRHMKK